MRKLLFTLAAVMMPLAASASDCAPPLKDAIEAYASAEIKEPTRHTCATRYRHIDMSQCLDDQFNYFVESLAPCVNEEQAADAVRAGTTYNRQGEVVGIDWFRVRARIIVIDMENALGKF